MEEKGLQGEKWHIIRDFNFVTFNSPTIALPSAYMSHPVDWSRKVFCTVGSILIFGHCRVNLLVNLKSLSQMIIRTFSGEYAAIIIIIVSIERTCLMWCFQRQLLCRASLSHRNIVTKGFRHHVSSFKLAWRKKIGNRDFSNANTFFKGYIKSLLVCQLIGQYDQCA